MKTIKTNPELLKIGQKCHLLSNCRWWGINTLDNQSNVYLPGVITEIHHSKDNLKTIVAINVHVRYSPKYKNPSLNMHVPMNQIEKNNEILTFN